MKNQSPMDRPKYEYGRYRDSYPRTTARNWAMREGVSEYEGMHLAYSDRTDELYLYYEKDLFFSERAGYNCHCFEECDENCVGHFPNQKPGASGPAYKVPVHDHESVKPRRAKHELCEHNWQACETKRYVERRLRYRYFWGNEPDYAGAWYPEDPVREIEAWDRCASCRHTRNRETVRRELFDYERANFDERVRMAQNASERLQEKRVSKENREKFVPGQKPIKKAKKAGRSRK